MTHRVALVLSIVLTLVVGVGVVASRDRLFAPESLASSATVTSVAAEAPSSNQAGQLPVTSPRIVTITLPHTPTTSGEAAQARSERDERSIDRERDDQGGGENENSEHEGEYDDD